MKKLKYQILFITLFITIGIAAVTSNLVINGNTNIASNLDDFSVYFSNVKVNGVQDLSLVKKSTSLVFNGEFSAVGDNKTITYEVTNASKNYDADIEISCTLSTTYLTISNSFDTSTNLSARSTRTGTLSVTLSKSYTGADLTQDISCTINASAVEKTSQGSGTVNAPLDPYYIGREISIGEEKFNVISTTDDTVTMYAQYNIGEDYKQINEVYDVFFQNSDNGWESTPGPKEIDIEEWSPNMTHFINEYVYYLNSEYNVLNVAGNLITLKELGDLGCTIPNDYAWVDGSIIGDYTCESSEHREWLVNGQNWWTRSASPDEPSEVWVMAGMGHLYSVVYDSAGFGVRPTITITRETADMLTTVYKVGKEIAIGEEKFNVISDNGTSVTMLAQYNISEDYRQSEEMNYIYFSEEAGWTYEPGPEEIDFHSWGSFSKRLLDNYVDYLTETLSDTSISGDLITLKELETLGCTIQSDYIFDDENTEEYTCRESKHNNWLINGQSWWTRSADSTASNKVWITVTNGVLTSDYLWNDNGVRPVITISKETLEKLN